MRHSHMRMRHRRPPGLFMPRRFLLPPPVIVLGQPTRRTVLIEAEGVYLKLYAADVERIAAASGQPFDQLTCENLLDTMQNLGIRKLKLTIQDERLIDHLEV